jgi:hypothetical protein
VLVSFPDSDLEVTVRAAWGADTTTDPATWTFTDLSSRLVSNPITISRGVLVGQGSHRSASTTLTLINDDGALTPLLATSPYWPYVDVGTPMDVSIRSNTTAWINDTFTRTVASGWGFADTGLSWGPPTGFSTNGSSGQITFSAANQTRTTSTPGVHRDAWVVWDASLSTVSTGAAHVVGPVIRSDGSGNNYIWPVVEFGVGGTVQWTVRSIQNAVEVIETGVTQPGLTYTAGQTIRCEVQLVGDMVRARAWDPTGSQPTTWAVSVQLSQLTFGKGQYVSMRAWCVGGNTNTQPTVISIDNLSFSQPRYPRIEGYITDVRPTFQQLPDGSTHSVVQIDIGGVGTRLERQDDAEMSPLRRSLEKSAVPPLVYWPCEDASGATQVASAFPAGTPMIVNGPAVFDFDLGVSEDALLRTYGTQSLCSIAAGASLLGLISPAVGSTAWTVSALIAQWTPGVGGGVTEVRMMEWATPGGTHNRWALVQTLTTIEVRAYNDSLGTVSTAATWPNTSGYLNGYDVAVSQSGGSINVSLYINAVQVATGTATATLGAVSRVTVNPDKVNTTASVNPFGIKFIAGHVMVHNAALTAAFPYYYDGSTLLRADRAWGYEYAHRRFVRQCAEERIPYKVYGNSYVSGTTQLNTQQPGTFTGLVTATAEAESGAVVIEDGYGYTLLPRSQRYNAVVSLTVDMATYRYQGGDGTDVLVPKLDSRGPNFWTVKRTGGSQAVDAAPAAYRNRRGTIRESATLDVLYDSDCAQHAGWRVHLFTDGQQANYPTLSLDLAANPALIDDYLPLKHGDRVQRTNQPTIAGLGTIDQVADGMSETFSPRRGGGPSWTATLDCSPAAPWQVGAFDTQRWDSASTTLAADLTAAGTVLPLSTTLAADVWATDEALMQLTVGAQPVTVQWMSGLDSVAAAEGGFETGITGWKSNNATLAQSSAFAHVGSRSLQVSLTGTPTSMSMSNLTSWPIAASTSYTATAWVYSAVAVNNVSSSISWFTGAGTLITFVTGTGITVPAGTWTQITVTGTSPGTAALVQTGVVVTGSPPAGTVIYVDDVDLCLSTPASPYVQNAWVIRDPVVTGALKAGTEVHVADPLWWAL